MSVSGPAPSGADMPLWDGLSEAWQVCLTLAWESYRQGSLPIAAVLVDAEGAVVARGRNRLRDWDGEPNVLHHHPLAHAEVNALLAFPFRERSAAGCTLLTTTEPCPLCVGALVMCNVRALVYASRDPWAGCSALFGSAPYIRRKGTEVESLAGSPLEDCLIALQLDAHMRVIQTPENRARFIDVWREIVPVGVAAVERLFRAGVLPELVRVGADVSRALAAVERAVLEAA